MADDLAARLIEISEIHGDFVLSAGQRSKIYFDKFRFLTDPGLLDEVSDAVIERLPGGVTHIAAPEGAATLLLGALGLKLKLPMAMVRKKRKKYGTQSLVEGHAPVGARVALVEDVATTGHQTLAAARALEEEGATIEIIVLTIDRGGADELRDAGYDVESIASIRPLD